MKKLIPILLLFPTLALASPIECFKTKQECINRRVNMTESEKSSYYCLIDQNPTQCQDQKMLEYQKKERIKKGASTSINNVTKLSDLPYDVRFDFSTSTLGGVSKEIQIKTLKARLAELLFQLIKLKNGRF